MCVFKWYKNLVDSLSIHFIFKYSESYKWMQPTEVLHNADMWCCYKLRGNVPLISPFKQLKERIADYLQWLGHGFSNVARGFFRRLISQHRESWPIWFYRRTLIWIALQLIVRSINMDDSWFQENAPLCLRCNIPVRRLIPFRVRHRTHGQAEQILPAVHFRGSPRRFESSVRRSLTPLRWWWRWMGGADGVTISATLTQRLKDVHFNS